MKLNETLIKSKWIQESNGWSYYHPYLKVTGYRLINLIESGAEVPKSNYELDIKKGLILWKKENIPEEVLAQIIIQNKYRWQYGLLLFLLLALLSFGASIWGFNHVGKIKNQLMAKSLQADSLKINNELLVKNNHSLSNRLNILTSGIDNPASSTDTEINSLLTRIEEYEIKMNDFQDTIDCINHNFDEIQTKYQALIDSVNKIEPFKGFIAEIYAPGERGQEFLQEEKCKLEKMGFTIKRKTLGSGNKKGTIEYGLKGEKAALALQKKYPKKFHSIVSRVSAIKTEKKINLFIY